MHRHRPARSRRSRHAQPSGAPSPHSARLLACLWKGIPRYGAAVLLWLNGAFGVGKTTTARLMTEGTDSWRPFDPESVGSMLKANLSDRALGGDFQHLPAWRRLVPVVAAEIRDHTGQDLVAVQTVLRENYWRELTAGLRDQGFQILHVVLDVEQSVLRDRIEADDAEPESRQWRLDHIDTYVSARRWMVAAADLVIDTTNAPAEDGVRPIVNAVGSRAPA